VGRRNGEQRGLTGKREGRNGLAGKAIVFYSAGFAGHSSFSTRRECCAQFRSTLIYRNVGAGAAGHVDCCPPLRLPNDTPRTRANTAMPTSLLQEASLYEILEVSPRARPAVIRAAYRSLVLEYHPDRNGGDPEAAERMAVINNAYAVLADPLKRAQYDERLGLGAIERRGNGRRSSPTRTDAGKDRAALRRFAFRPLE
jgi:hypothetical protein